jgi:hypothetical protein
MGAHVNYSAKILVPVLRSTTVIAVVTVIKADHKYGYAIDVNDVALDLTEQWFWTERCMSHAFNIC